MAEVSLELIQAMLHRVLETQSQHTSRFSRLEDQIVVLSKVMLSVRQGALTDAEVTVLVNDRLTALAQRVERIESRLNLHDA